MSLEETFSTNLTLEKAVGEGGGSSQSSPSHKPSGSLRKSNLSRTVSTCIEESKPFDDYSSSNSRTNDISSSSPTGSVVKTNFLSSWKRKTKSTTHSLIRRWKTLPEHNPEYESSWSRQSSTDQEDISQMPAKENFTMSQNHRKDKSSRNQNAPTGSRTGWSVHVWSTYVQRGDEDECMLLGEESILGRSLLSEFQKDKLIHFYNHVLDMNHDNVISAEDFVALNQRIRHYIEWSSECIEFHILKEVHSGFLETFLNQPLDQNSTTYYCSDDRETKQHVNVEEWLDVWGTMLQNVRILEQLPLWLQYLPKILFRVINKSGSGTITKEDLRAFYTMFLGIDFRIVNESMEMIYDAMTDKGSNKMTYPLFKLCFTNFLLGKQPHGPGQFLFGICSPETLMCPFPIDYSAMNSSPDDLEPFDPSQQSVEGKRRSVIV